VSRDPDISWTFSHANSFRLQTRNLFTEIFGFRTLSIVRIFLTTKEKSGRWKKSENTIFLCVIHHRRRNLLSCDDLVTSFLCPCCTHSVLPLSSVFLLPVILCFFFLFLLVICLNLTVINNEINKVNKNKRISRFGVARMPRKLESFVKTKIDRKPQLAFRYRLRGRRHVAQPKPWRRDEAHRQSIWSSPQQTNSSRILNVDNDYVDDDNDNNNNTEYYSSIKQRRVRWGIDLTQDRDQWRALVNMGMNLWVP
jgi:hypothetical protein